MVKWQHHPNGNYYLDWVDEKSPNKNNLSLELSKIQNGLYIYIITQKVKYKEYKFGGIILDKGLQKSKKIAEKRFNTEIEYMKMYFLKE